MTNFMIYIIILFIILLTTLFFLKTQKVYFKESFYDYNSSSTSLSKNNQQQATTTKQVENKSSLNFTETFIKCIKCGLNDCNGNCSSKTKPPSCSNDSKSNCSNDNKSNCSNDNKSNCLGQCYNPPEKKDECSNMICPACPKCPPSTIDLSQYVRKSSIPPCPKCPDMDDYIKKSQIPECPKCPDMTRYVLKSSIPPCPPVSKCCNKDCPPCPPCPRPRCPKIKCEKIIYQGDDKRKCYTQDQIDKMLCEARKEGKNQRDNKINSEDAEECIKDKCDNGGEFPPNGFKPNSNNSNDGEPKAYNATGSLFDMGF